MGEEKINVRQKICWTPGVDDVDEGQGLENLLAEVENPRVVLGMLPGRREDLERGEMASSRHLFDDVGGTQVTKERWWIFQKRGKPIAFRRYIKPLKDFDLSFLPALVLKKNEKKKFCAADCAALQN